ncbi:MAG: membrane protease subunit HflC [Gammaproteobacteria bacterium]|jgi:membrane protease subunit HflC|tara:strand:+ start:2978 stop:3847 length:870 start_codon:yes stop_codon:yes gene_type:complete
MNIFKPVFVLIIAFVLLVVSQSLFTVDERELAIKFRFGEIVGSDFTPGLHFKFPFVNNVEKYPKRILTLSNPQELFLTFEKKNLYVDFFVKWRIVNIDNYYNATRGDELVAKQRLLEQVKDGIRSEFAKRTVPEVVTAERRELMADMMRGVRENAKTLGIEVVDVRVKRIEFSEEVSDSVFRRMRQERARVASELRAEGAEAAEQIRADAERKRTVLLAEAYRDAEITRGTGDAKAAEIYAAAYSKNPEFYAFYRSISAYRRSLGNAGDLLVIAPDGEFFRYLNNSTAK